MSVFAIEKDELKEIVSSLRESISKNNENEIKKTIHSFIAYLRKSGTEKKANSNVTFSRSANNKNIEQEKLKLKESSLILITPYLLPEHNPAALVKNIPKYLSQLPKMQCAQVMEGILERMRHIFTPSVVAESYDVVIEWAKKENLQFFNHKIKARKN